eukprot:363076-Chlamydomonas_euryale.AAC.8
MVVAAGDGWRWLQAIIAAAGNGCGCRQCLAVVAGNGCGFRQWLWLQAMFVVAGDGHSSPVGQGRHAHLTPLLSPSSTVLVPSVEVVCDDVHAAHTVGFTHRARLLGGPMGRGLAVGGRRGRANKGLGSLTA